MTDFNLYDDEADFLDWKLRTVMPDGEITEDYKTVRDAMNEGYKVLFEDTDSLVMFDPYNNWTTHFVLDKTTQTKEE